MLCFLYGGGGLICGYREGQFCGEVGDEPWNDRKFLEKSVNGRVIIPVIQLEKADTD